MFYCLREIVLAQIRVEGFENSHVLEVFNHLTNVNGPRLTASPGYGEAVEWTRDKMIEWDFEDVHLESWEFGRGCRCEVGPNVNGGRKTVAPPK